MKSGGLNIRIGTYPGGLWYDSKPTANIPRGYGINLAVIWGKLHLSVPKIWKKESFTDKYGGDNIWFTVKLPWFIGPLLTVSAGKYGFYIGFKQNGWGDNSSIMPTARATKSRDI